MCDYSLQTFKSRPAAVGDRLQVFNFGLGTRGFIEPGQCDTAVCVLPGTELAFDQPIQASVLHGYPASGQHEQKTAIFRQIHKDQARVHHDVVELGDGTRVMLTHLIEGQRATVLQLPAKPRNKAERDEQTRAAYTG